MILSQFRAHGFSLTITATFSALGSDCGSQLAQAPLLSKPPVYVWIRAVGNSHATAWMSSSLEMSSMKQISPLFFCFFKFSLTSSSQDMGKILPEHLPDYNLNDLFLSSPLKPDEVGLHHPNVSRSSGPPNSHQNNVC